MAQQPYVHGLYIDAQWTRFRSASVALEPCDVEGCSVFSMHRCRLSQWLSPPALEPPSWTLVSRQSRGYLLSYYSRKTPPDVSGSQIDFIGDILVLKLECPSVVADMTAEDIVWVEENLLSLL
jgi:hypothetical protein